MEFFISERLLYPISTLSAFLIVFICTLGHNCYAVADGVSERITDFLAKYVASLIGKKKKKSLFTGAPMLV